ncbi:MAG: hypothetical protein A2X24_06795 [Chloroflexi bacterium GWB2_54_36]|nr:MAG: hypothetical protein A2X24_06795 [Chloroflexi bacterium GWB2_54_36]
MITRAPFFVVRTPTQNAVGFKANQEAVKRAFWQLEMLAQLRQRHSIVPLGEVIQEIYETIDGFDRRVFHKVIGELGKAGNL